MSIQNNTPSVKKCNTNLFTVQDLVSNFFEKALLQFKKSLLIFFYYWNLYGSVYGLDRIRNPDSLLLWLTFIIEYFYFRRSPDAGTWRDISTSPSTDVRQTGLAARAPSPPPPLTPSSPSSPSISTSSTHKGIVSVTYKR